ncbi:phospholipase D family protein [Lysinibacillus capsici]|uniref:phospholipase D family protein n=1 Tax=Lysinibacillus capsici TaxID=2115968 RepID=UPI0034E2CDEB
MTKITLLKILDQPLGRFRLLDALEDCLNDADLHSFKFSVAFAKLGPLLRLDNSITNWKSNSKHIEGIFGIDHQGTSQQALEYATQNFTNAYYIHTGRSTFHPKMYLFYGDSKAVVFIGSHNLTVGGTETNFESGLKIEFDLTIPSEAKEFKEFHDSWQDLIPHCLLLDTPKLNALISSGALLDESKRVIRSSSSSSGSGSSSSSIKTSPSFSTKPPRAISKGAITKIISGGTPSPTTTAPPISTTVPGVNSLAIQITPKANGEILLSKLAVNQNPGFWGYPFTGFSTPKKASNPPYPQRTPDPIVNVNLFNSSGIQINRLNNYNLNTVYYSTKGEIRITFPSGFLPLISDFLMMVITTSTSSTVDYEIDIFEPGSIQYTHYLTCCNQTLPSGGKPISRKMGWI